MARHDLSRYPFPLAYAARLVDVADSPIERLERASDFVQLTVVTMGVLALGWCRSHSVDHPSVQQWEADADGKGMALGKWTKMLRSVQPAMTAHPGDPVARAVGLVVKASLPRWETFTPIRNVYAHGGKPVLESDVAAAAVEHETRASAILDGLVPLAAVRLGRIRESRPADGEFEVAVDRMTGFQHPFDREHLRSGRSLDRSSVIAYHGDSMDFAIELSPYCVWKTCAVCGHDELFYLTRRRKLKNEHFSFTTGHHLTVQCQKVLPADSTFAVAGTQPLGARLMAATSGWRATWADLATRPYRLAARAIDALIVGLLALVGLLPTALAELPGWLVLIATLLLPLAYEPVVVALIGGTIGKRLLRIEPISTSDCRPLGRRDALFRAALVSLQLLAPWMWVRNVAWILWDPGRQCFHDRWVRCIVVAGLSRTGQNV